MSSTDVERVLVAVDHQQEVLVERLPFFKRLRRRYFTGSYFWGYQAGATVTFLKFIFGKKLILLAAKTWPGAASVVIKAWGWVTAAFAGALAVFNSAV